MKLAKILEKAKKYLFLIDNHEELKQRKIERPDLLLSERTPSELKLICNTLDFNEDDLVKECAKNIQYEVSVNKIKYLYSKAKNKITKVGVEVDEETLIKDKYIDSEIIDYKLPDIVTYIQNETNLTRRNIVDILIKSEKLNDFKNNPQKFIDKVIEIIKKTMNSFIVDGIKYQKLGNDYYYTQESFENEELTGYLKKNMYENKNNTEYRLEIFDIKGNTVFSGFSNEGTILVKANGIITVGEYLYKITSNGNLLQNGKIIKNY